MKNKLLLYAFFILVLFGCQETFDAYIGVNMQPEFETNNYRDGLNILGILRPDSMAGINISFVHLQKVLPAVNSDPNATWILDSSALENSLVVVKWQESESSNEVVFDYTNHDSLFKEEQFRAPQNFFPKVGLAYKLECLSKDLPVLTAETIIPNQPQINEQEIKIENQQISLTIKNDSSAFLYDVLFYADTVNVIYHRIKPEVNTNTSVVINTQTLEKGELYIYAYDKNLAAYYLNSNTSLNFNKYRVPYSTVENGYGVFGSVNVLKTKISP